MSNALHPFIHFDSFSDSDSFPMVYVQGGTFLLGEKVKTQISSFYLGQYLVTQSLWHEIMKENPSSFSGDFLPINRVSWYDCVDFCNRLSECVGLEPAYKIDKSMKNPNNINEYDWILWKVTTLGEANGYRLPKVTEWEYAARGGIYGNNFSYSYTGSDEVNQVAWHLKNCNREPQLLGLKAPNQLGIYGMSGNLMEWCGDYDTAHHPESKGWIINHTLSLLGGSAFSPPNSCKNNSKYEDYPAAGRNAFGLRLARTAKVF